MKLSKNKKIGLIIATLWPILYTIIFIAVGFYIDFQSTLNGSEGLPDLFTGLSIMHILTMFEMLVLFGIYINIIVNGNLIKKDERYHWILFIIFVPYIAMLIFCYRYIWKESSKNRK